MFSNEEMAVVIHRMMDLIQDPDHWGKGTNFKDINNLPLVEPVILEEIHQYCLQGALMRASGFLEFGRVFASLANQVHCYLHLCVPDPGPGGYLRFNDDPSTTHEDVMLFLKTAVYSLERQRRWCSLPDQR